MATTEETQTGVLFTHGRWRVPVLLDLADLEWAQQFKWYLNRSGYASRHPGGERYILLHRALLGLVHGDGLQVDHVNRDRLDNRRANLRLATHAENAQNRGARGRSGYRGVYWREDQHRWVVRVMVDYVEHYGGAFDSLEDAIARAVEMRAELMPFSQDALRLKDAA